MKFKRNIVSECFWRFKFTSINTKSANLKASAPEPEEIVKKKKVSKKVISAPEE